jgi:N-acylneuraminate cytidylyltransferase
MANLCIIPARGGSKRIPRKNIKDFLGKPIIAYAIETALKSNLFDEVMVSTDDEEIATIAKQYGAKVPFMRSKETANDFATTYAVIEEVLNSYKQHFDNACCIYPCTPLIDEFILKSAFQLLQETNCDTIFPLIEYSHPIQRAYQLKDGKALSLHPENALIRTQDLPKTYHDAGQFYFFKVNEILNQKKIITDNVSSIVISEMDAQDIDNEIDWKLAELKYQLKNGISK